MAHPTSIDGLQYRAGIDARSRQLTGDPPPVEDEDSLAQRRQFVRFRGAEQDHRSLRGNGLDEAVHFSLGSDVDTAGGVIEEEIARRMRARHPVAVLSSRLYLCDPGSGFVTGAAINADGGFAKH